MQDESCSPGEWCVYEHTKDESVRDGGEREQQL